MHHTTLFNSKLCIKKEILNQEIAVVRCSGGKNQPSSVEKELEKEIKKREEECERIKNDIERIQSYQPVDAK